MTEDSEPELIRILFHFQVAALISDCINPIWLNEYRPKREDKRYAENRCVRQKM
uniref:Uncharacterized protein n=1 Tax=Arion vulgaris TaxID=1028688 RepID=A0A0B6YH66_9EUPU